MTVRLRPHPKRDDPIVAALDAQLGSVLKGARLLAMTLPASSDGWRVMVIDMATMYSLDIALDDETVRDGRMSDACAGGLRDCLRRLSALRTTKP